MYDEYQKNASNLSATQKTAQENAIIAKEKEAGNKKAGRDKGKSPSPSGLRSTLTAKVLADRYGSAVSHQGRTAPQCARHHPRAPQSGADASAAQGTGQAPPARGPRPF